MDSTADSHVTNGPPPAAQGQGQPTAPPLPPARSWVHVTAVVTAVLFVVDVVATFFGVQVLGYAVEGNPLLAWVQGVSNLGVALVVSVAFRLALLLGLWLIATRARKPRERRIGAIAIAVACLVHLALAAWHLYGYVVVRPM